MALQNLNIFIILFILTAAIALFFGIYSLIISPFRKASASFAALSFVTAISSFSCFVTLTTDVREVALIWSYVVTIGIFLSPISLLLFIIDFTENRFFKLKVGKYLKLSLFYILPAFIIVFIIFTKNIKISDTIYGYVVRFPLMNMLGPAYFTLIYILAISIISFDIYSKAKARVSYINSIFLLSGICVFSLIMMVLGSFLESSSSVEENPIVPYFLFSFSTFILYIFTTTTLFTTKINIKNLTLKRIFENAENAILITDSKGNIIDMNNSAYSKLLGEKISVDKIKNDKVKSLLQNMILDKDKAKKLFENLESSSISNLNLDIDCKVNDNKKTYNVEVSPILDNSKRIFGKIAIFRDITESKLLQDRLKEQSEKDFLTDSFNQRYLYERLYQEIKRFERYKEPFCLLYIDIDNFKQFNDMYGHLKGDWLLKKTATILKNNIREGIDIVSRYGGDEFIIILVNTNLEKAKEVAERIIHQYNKLDIEDVSLSIGICQYQDNMSNDDIVKNADFAMYKAKKSGKNQVWICSGSN